MHVGIANPRWWDKRSRHSRHSRRMCNPQFYVSGKRRMVAWYCFFFIKYDHKRFQRIHGFKPQSEPSEFIGVSVLKSSMSPLCSLSTGRPCTWKEHLNFFGKSYFLRKTYQHSCSRLAIKLARWISCLEWYRSRVDCAVRSSAPVMFHLRLSMTFLIDRDILQGHDNNLS